MELPKPFAKAWRWIEHAHTVYWLWAVLIDSSLTGFVVGAVATYWNQLPLSLGIVFGVMGCASALFLAVVITQVVYFFRPSSPVAVAPIVSPKETINQPPLVAVNTGKIRIRRFAIPSDTDGINISQTPNKMLGDLIVALADDTKKIIENNQFASNAELIEKFNKKVAPHFLWSYEEARNRGHRDQDLEKYFEDPGKISVFKAEEKMRMLGSRLHLYIDS